MIELCCIPEKRQRMESFIKKQTSFPDAWESKRFTGELEQVVRKMFRFGSSNSHAGEHAKNVIPDNNSCREYLRLLFDFFCAYFDIAAKYDGSLIPMLDYYPVSKKLCVANGIVLPEGKHFFVRSANGTVEYYIFTDARSTISDMQKRDIETLDRLWMKNVDTPQNVLNNAHFISNKNNTDYRYLVHPLPSFPQSMTDDYIASISIEMKMQLIRGIVRGLASMHTAEPPFYHRTLSLSSFLVCGVRGILKPILVNFDCVKDTDEDAGYTVFVAVCDKISTQESPELLFAPELLVDEVLDGDGIDWAKVDIYALGKCIIKLLTNSYTAMQDKPDGVSRGQYDMLKKMCDDLPELRPDIAQVQSVF